ncbi:hypothetical protein BJ741DRAFT_710713 [Chytriomyces cf. hyalinus JEL632]|nr:hypothetical protein BJ741DRAFT_710713 [Chytriomyces cf. hyalinus JEL632]
MSITTSGSSAPLDETSPLLGSQSPAISVSKSLSTYLVELMLVVAITLAALTQLWPYFDPEPLPIITHMEMSQSFLDVRIRSRGGSGGDTKVTVLTVPYSPHRSVMVGYEISGRSTYSLSRVSVKRELEDQGTVLAIDIDYPYHWFPFRHEMKTEMLLALPGAVRNFAVLGHKNSLIWQGLNINESLSFSADTLGGLRILRPITANSLINVFTKEGIIHIGDSPVSAPSINLTTLNGHIQIIAREYTNLTAFASHQSVQADLTPAAKIRTNTTIRVDNNNLLAIVRNFEGHFYAETKDEGPRLSGLDFPVESLNPATGWVKSKDGLGSLEMHSASLRLDFERSDAIVK